MALSVAAPLRFENLTLGYERHPAIHHLSAEIEPGALVAVVGPNGAGKSTLLKGIMGLLRPLGGAIDYAGQQCDIAYMPQREGLDESFPLSVFDMVAMGLWHEVGAFGCINKKGQKKVEAAISAVGLKGFESRLVGSLSGGQLQRARFARLSLQDAPLILLDEPFAAVDSRTVDDLAALILKWHVEGRTVLAVVHDLDLVKTYFPLCLLLAREQIAFGKTLAVLTDELLGRAYKLCEAFNENALECQWEEAS